MASTPVERTPLYTVEPPWNEDTSVYSETLYSNHLKWGHLTIKGLDMYQRAKNLRININIICLKISGIEIITYNNIHITSSVWGASTPKFQYYIVPIELSWHIYSSSS